MIRREVIGNATLYLGDCREVLPTLGHVDAVVTDPPYGIGFAKGAGGHGKHDRRNLLLITGDDAPFDPTPWLGFDQVILWGADHYANRLPEGRWLVWDKLDGIGSFDSFSDVEVAWSKQRGAARIYRHLWKGICQASGNDEGRYHPSQKPIPLMIWCLSFTTGVVLDPFMGCGTTGIAAARLWRPFIGVECELRYFDIACRRIEEAQRQPDLFIDAPAPEPPEDERMADLFAEAAE